jgi:hypothetical protein
MSFMMKWICTFVMTMFTCLAFAQQETPVADSLPVIENVMIYKDARLDILEKRAALLEIEERNKANEKQTINAKPIVSASGKKKVTGSIYTAKGYRIMIYNGPDRKKAMEAKNTFSKLFSSYRSYMSYNVPSYKIKVGDFEDRAEAGTLLRQVNKLFPTSFIVPDIVTIKNINVVE